MASTQDCSTKARAAGAPPPSASVSTVSSLESVQLNEWQKVIKYDSQFEEVEFAIGEFATLQRYNLILIQNRLAKIKAWIALGAEAATAPGLEAQANINSNVNNVPPFASNPQAQVLQDTLHHYANAIRDFACLAQFEKFNPVARRASLQDIFADFAVQGTIRPFATNFFTPRHQTQRVEDPIREYLRKRLPLVLSWGPDEKRKRGQLYRRRQRPQEYSPVVDRLARFIVAFLGGASLVVPMLIMSFGYSRTKSLVTTSVAVVLFAVAVSVGFHTDNKETVTATSTYAAVLVVFVGASGPTA